MSDHVKSNNKTFRKNKMGGDTSNDMYSKYEPVQAIPLEIKVYGNEFDKAMKAFRALVQKERTLSNYKEKQSYEKPSDKKRRKKNEMKRKLLELNTKEEKF